jgi:tetratricopeptide (TPR) repeat protein
MKAIILAGAALLGMVSPVAAQAADGCTAHQAEKNAFSADLTAAFALMEKRDIAGATQLLPKLEAYLARSPASMPAPQTCGTEVIVYDHHQFLRFTALQAAGRPVPGYAKDTKFTESALDFNSLAYAVGWLRYENKNFDKALAAYAKGLAIAPGDHDLSNEYVATLLNQGNYAGVIGFVDQFLGSDTDIDAKAKGAFLGAKAIAQWKLGNTPAAKATAAAALQLDPGNESIKSFAATLP